MACIGKNTIIFMASIKTKQQNIYFLLKITKMEHTYPKIKKMKNSYRINFGWCCTNSRKFFGKLSVVLVFIIFSVSGIFAQVNGDYQTRATGNWNANTTWQKYNGTTWVNCAVGDYPGVAVGAGTVSILDGHTVTLNISPANNIGSLDIPTGGNDSYIVFSGTNSLSVTGATTCSSDSNNDEKAIHVDAGTFSTGSFEASGGGASQDAYIRISTGTVNVSGNVTLNNAAARTYILFTSTGILNVGGTITGGNITSTTGGGTDVPTSGTVNYNNATSQTIGTYTYYNLQTSIGGTKSLAGNVTVNNQLILSSGLLTLGINNLTLAAGASVSGTPSATNMVVTNGTGQFIKNFATGNTAAFTFPIGETTGTTEYSPVTLDFSTNSVAQNIGVRVTDAVHASMGGVSDYLSRYWSFTASGAGTYDYTGSMTYLAADIVGSESAMKLGLWNGATWSSISGSTVGTNQINITSALDETTGTLNGRDFTGRTDASCPPVTPPYSEDFESITVANTLPSCMAATNLGTNVYTAITTGSYNRMPHSGTDYAYFDYSCNDWLFTEGLNLAAGITYRFSFWYVTDGYSGWTTLNAFFGNAQNSGAMTTAITGATVSGPMNTTYVQMTGTFTPSSSGVYYCGIHCTANSTPWYLSIDDIAVEELLPCAAPGDQATGLNLTPSYATVDGSFTAASSAPDGYLVIRSTDGTLSGGDLPVNGATYVAGNTIGDGTVVYSGANTTFNATGLSMNTTYYFYVFSQNFECSGGPLYLTTGPLSGNTSTLAGTPFPYSHNFDTQDNWAVGGTADIWQRGDQTDGAFGPTSGHSGYTVYGTVLNNNYNVASIAAYLYTPIFDMSGAVAPRLSFWMDMESENGYDGGILQISVNGGAWTTITQADYTRGAPNDATVTGLAGGLGWTGNQPTDEWQESVMNLFSLTGIPITAGDAIQFRFWFGSDGSFQTYPGWYIDDFNLFEPNDQTSQADAPTSGQIPVGTIASIANSSADAVDVFRFDISDLGSGDGLSTFVNRIEISKGGGTADWTDHIAGAELWSGGVIIPDMTVLVTDGDIIFTKNTGYFEVGDGTSRELTLRLWLTGTNNVDNSTMIFQIPTTGHGFTADVSGSEFNTTFPGAVTSNTFTVTVTATQLEFSGQPSTTATSGVPLVVQPIVTATDIHGNVDLDVTSNVTLANTGGLTMANTTMAFVSGVANYGTAGTFQFTTGGKYVMLTATAGALSSIVPSNEIAVDIVGCVLFDEDFETYADRTDLPTPDGLWTYYEITNSANDWGIGSNGGDQFLSIYNGNTQQQYSFTDDGETVAYYTALIDAREFKNLSLDFNWFCEGAFADYGSVVWSLNGTDWQLVSSAMYYSEATFQTVTGLDLSVCDGQQFYIGFRWINDGSGGTNPPFAVDDIVLRGYPKFDYNFSYRDDVFSQITGTVVALDGQGGVNISLPTGFSFQYDGVPVTAVRVNENGWMEVGTSHTADPAATNDLQSLINVPFLAPFWDNLVYDAQSRIIYAVDGTAPARVFTVEWKDIFWGVQRQNFQVKLYETSNVIEFWYGVMNTYASGSASIGINNDGGCMNKLISIVPGTIPSASYSSEYNTINSAQYLTEGLVYVFNPLEMQNYMTWQNATVLVGQANWGATSTTVNQSTSAGANSSSVSSRGVLAVGSAYANRILLWNTIQTSNSNPADVVIGQANFTSLGSGTSSTTLNSPYNVCYTPDGEKLIVADSYNNRVLIWNTIPTDMAGAPYAADVVIGQTDFTSSTSGTSATRLNFPTGVIVLPDGRLIITDNGNNRVLIYNSVPTTNGAVADIVIGQNDFTSSSSGSTANKFDQPWDCAYTPDGKLLVSDDGAQSSGNHRILIFNTVPTTNGASADLVIGNTIFAAKASGSSRTEFDQPSVTCSVEGKIAIADFANSRVIMYERVPKINGAPADYVLGQPNFIDNPQYNDGYGATGTPDQRNMYFPYSICFDLNGRLYVNGTQAGGTGMNRVMIFGEIPTETAELALNIQSDAVDVCIYNDVEYIVEVTNNGPDAASGVVVNAQLPIGFLPTDHTTSVGTYNQKSGYWMIPYISIGETVTLSFTGEVQPGLAGTTITAYANIIASKQADSDYSNNGDNQVVAIRNFSAPTISLIDDQYINRNSHTIPVIGFTVNDDDGLADISSYTCTSSNTVLIPVNYVTNLLFGGSAPNMTLDIYPATDQYGYSDMVLRVADLNGCYNEEDFRVIVGNIWEGDMMLGGTQWHQAGNWSSNQVPTSTIEAIIPTSPVGGFFPIISIAGAECEDLVIEPNAYVTLNNTRTLHIYGDLFIQSSSLGTGSFLDLNSAGFNQVTIDGGKYVDRYIFNDAWHYVSSPLTGVSNKVLTEAVCGAYNPNVIEYNEPYIGLDWMAGWQWPFITPNVDPLITGKGYGYYTFSGICTDQVQFTGGSLNTGPYSVLVTNQDQSFSPTGFGPHRGWNLVGNPYPSGLDAIDFMAANSGVIDGTVYFWDEVGGTGFNAEGSDYAAFNSVGIGTTGTGSGAVVPDKFISNGQAFFVHRTITDPAGTNIVFNNTMREAENSYFFKKEKTAIVEIPKIKLSVLNPVNMYNECVVFMMEDATEGRDPKYDGYKIEGNPQLAFYSKIGNEHFIFQGIPYIDKEEAKSIALGLHAGIEGTYTISPVLIEYIPESIGVYLEDTYMDKMVDLRQTASYEFAIETAGRYDDRFVLHFNMNHTPEVLNPIEDKIIIAENYTEFDIPATTFGDVDEGDVLSYTATFTDGSSLPDWIDFMQGSLKFRAMPDLIHVGEYTIRVTANDSRGAGVYDDFKLSVVTSSGLEEVLSDISIYPNPTSGRFTIKVEGSELYTYRVRDITGKQFIENKAVGTVEVDLSTYASGIYLIQVTYEGKNLNYKLMLK
jgi:hypothetical protein